MAKKPDIQYIRYYSTGSAARVAEVAVPRKKTGTLPKPKKQQIVLHIGPLAFVGLFVCVVMVALMAVGMFSLQEIKEEQDRLEAYVDDLAMKNGLLHQEYEEGYDLKEVETLALGLGMIPMEEARHISVDLETAPVYQVSEDSGHSWLTDLFG